MPVKLLSLAFLVESAKEMETNCALFGSKIWRNMKKMLLTSTVYYLSANAQLFSPENFSALDSSGCYPSSCADRKKPCVPGSGRGLGKGFECLSVSLLQQKTSWLATVAKFCAMETLWVKSITPSKNMNPSSFFMHVFLEYQKAETKCPRTNISFLWDVGVGCARRTH